MTTLFWFALVVGGGLMLVSMLGHLLGDVFGGDAGGSDLDSSGGPDLQVEAAAGADAAGAEIVHAGATAGGMHAGDAHAAGDHEGYRLLSFRTAIYFLFGFGASGVLLTFAWGARRPVATAVAALVVGSLAAWLCAALFRWVGRGEAGALAGDRALVGATGVVTLPLPPDGTGKVLVQVGGRELELLARPLEDTGPGDPSSWTDVMVVDVVDGVAVVTPSDRPAV